MTNTLLFERFTTVAPLGLRFWDSVTNSFVLSGLQVFAAPKGNPAQQTAATVSSHGVYGFAHLPGLRQLENGAGDAAYWATLPAAAKRDFRITLTDPEG